MSECRLFDTILNCNKYGSYSKFEAGGKVLM